MTARESARKTILLIREEEFFPLFLQHFSASDYSILFAVGAAEAMTLCEIHAPALMVVPLSGGGDALVSALAQVRREGAPILAVQDPAKPVDIADTGLGDNDRAVEAEDPEQIIEAAREMLQERRARPRVNVEFPVKLDDRGGGIARDVSETAVRIHTLESLTVGQAVSLEIGWGDKPYRFEAVVSRIQKTALGPNAVALEVSESATETREYLKKLVQRILEVEHYLRGSRSAKAGLRGPPAWKLARRAEASIRQSRELQALHNLDLSVETATEFEIRYRLGEPVARWGVGEVFTATHRLLERPVWVKRLSSVVKDDPVARERFEQEAQVASTLFHPGIIDVIDFGVDGAGGLYYATEVLEGETLQDALNKGQRFTVLDLGRLGVHLAMALAHAHKNGVGHQDLCPANIFLKRQGDDAPVQPKLINFSGKMSGSGAAETYAEGEAFYPPDGKGKPLRRWFDVYGLGAVLDHLLYQWGKDVPKEGPEATGSGGKLFVEAINKAIAEKREDRFASMEQMVDALRESLEQMESEAPADQAAVIAPVTGVGTKFPAAEAPPVAAIGATDTGREVARASRPSLRKATRQGRSRLGVSPPAAAADSAGRQVAKASRPSMQKDTQQGRAQLHPSAPAGKPAGEKAQPGKPQPDAKETLLWGPGTDGAPAPARSEPADARPSEKSVSEEENKAAPAEGVPDIKEMLDEAVASGTTDEAPSKSLEESALVKDQTPSAIPVRPLRTTAKPVERSYRLKMAAGVGVFVVGVSVVVLAIVWGLSVRKSHRGEPDSKAAETTGKRSPEDAGTVAADAAADKAVADAAPAAVAVKDAAPAAVAVKDAAPASRAVTDAAPASRPSPDAAPRKTSPDKGPDKPDAQKKSKKELRKHYIAQGRHLISRGQYRKARTSLDKALKLRDGPRLRKYFARTYEALGKYWSAIHHLKKAVAMSPRSTAYRMKLGSLYIKVDKRARACKQFKRVLNARPGYRRASRHLFRYCGGPRPRRRR